MPHYLAVAQVDQQADAVPASSDAHVGQVAARVGARRAAAEAPRHHVRHVGPVGHVAMTLEPFAPVRADQAVSLIIRQMRLRLAVMPARDSAAFILLAP